MIRSAIRAAVVGVLLSWSAPGPAFAQTGTVEGIEVLGLRQMTIEAFHHAFGVRAGDPYDPVRIRAQYRRLWALGLFDDLRIVAEDGPGGGKVLVVRVKERRTLSSVAYEDNKVLTRTAIEDRLKEKKATLETGKPLNLKTVFDAENVIRDLLAEKGYLDAIVRHKVDEPTPAVANVSFEIRPGAKTRIRKITFVGNKVYKTGKLLDQLKLTRPYRWYWPLSSKALYHPAKWDQDAGGIRDLYQNAGYLDVDVRPPVVDLKEVRRAPEKEKKKKKKEEVKAEPAAPPEPIDPKEAQRLLEQQVRDEEQARQKAEKAAKKERETVKQRWAYLTVRIDEGKQYKLGEVTTSGNALLTDDQVKGRIFLKPGSVFNNAIVDLGIQAIQKDYQNRGYAYATARREIVRRENEPIADLKIVVNEDKPYYVSRIEFTGNVLTQDRVLRREFRLGEGDLYNASLLDLSVGKVNQLGYFDVKREEVIVEPIEGEGLVRITVPGEEKERNEIQVGGGYSGLEGAFFQGLYSTRNFLGRGETLSASLQVGGRQNLYQLSFVEPWFMGKPYTFGVSIYRRNTDYGATLKSTAQGAGFVFGRQFGWFTSGQIRYDIQKATSRGFALNGAVAEYIVSSVSPSVVHNRIDNPYRPTSGYSIEGGLEVAGGPLGGDTYYLRPRIAYTGYHRAIRNTFFAIHAEGGMIRTWAGGSPPSTANVEGVPRQLRYFLGGDIFGPRIFETRTVTPLRYVQIDPYGFIVDTTRDPRGKPAAYYDRNGDQIVNRSDLVEMGGDRYWMIQTEYVVAFNNPVELAFFVDVANAMFEDDPWGFREMRASAGVELRFYLPVFPVPLRLIYGVPVRQLPQDRTSSFTFSIGRSF